MLFEPNIKLGILSLSVSAKNFQPMQTTVNTRPGTGKTINFVKLSSFEHHNVYA
jgi:hypothetical protein